GVVVKVAVRDWLWCPRDGYRWHHGAATRRSGAAEPVVQSHRDAHRAGAHPVLAPRSDALLLRGLLRGGQPQLVVDRGLAGVLLLVDVELRLGAEDPAGIGRGPGGALAE